MTPAVGQKFGPYEILARLGRGGMGLVFRAWDGRLHREVALKLLHNEYPVPGSRERFLQEARAASALNHPNICTIFDIGDQDGAPYLVMELMEGQTLKARIDHSPIPLDEIVLYSQEITGALGAAHARGIIHRDVKPANIFLVDKPTGGCQIKVLDFGLAKVDHAIYGALDQRARHITSDGATVGTVAYMSPEQARGEFLDPRTDLFSLGVVMYEMATRHVPFPGATSALAFVQLLQHEPEHVRDWNEAVPKDLEKLILKLLCKDPAQRYQNASELSTALSQLNHKNGGGWLKRATQAAAPLVRASDPIARERRIVRRSSDPHAAEAVPSAQAESKVGGSSQFFRPAVQLPTPPPQNHRSPEPLPNPQDAFTGDLSPVDLAAAADPRLATPEPAPRPYDPILSHSRNTPIPAQQPIQQPAPLPPGRLARKRRLKLGIAAVVILIPAIAGGVFFVRAHFFKHALLGRNDLLLITSIENRTSDGTLDGTIAQALEIELQESSYFALSGRDAFRSALRRSGAVPDQTQAQPQAQAIARQAAQAVGAKAFLFGNIHASGTSTILSVDAFDTASNRRVASAEETAESREQIPQAVDRLAETLRAELGEPSGQPDVPLRREATANLDALYAYTQGEAALIDGRTDAALAAFQQATRLEPKFAQAQICLAWLYRSELQEQPAAAAATLAQTAAAGASDHATLLAQYAFAVNASGDLPHAADLIRKFVAEYPHDSAGSAGLARVLLLQGQLPEALAAAQRGLTDDPFDTELYTQAESALIQLDRYDAALALEQQSQRLALAHDGLTLTAAWLAGKDDLLSSAVERVTRPPRNLQSTLAYGAWLDGTGQLASSSILWRAAPPSPGQTGDPALLAQGAFDLALVGDCNAALDMAHSATASSAPNQLSPSLGASAAFHAGLAAGLCNDKPLASSLLTFLKRNHPQSTLVASIDLPSLAAAAALGDHQPEAALTALDPAQASNSAAISAYLRGLAHLALKQHREALVDFQSVLDRHGVAAFESGTLYPLAQINLARAYAAAGDSNNSREAYHHFLDLWPVDPTQPLRAEALAATAH